MTNIKYNTNPPVYSRKPPILQQDTPPNHTAQPRHCHISTNAAPPSHKTHTNKLLHTQNTQNTKNYPKNECQGQGIAPIEHKALRDTHIKRKTPTCKKHRKTFNQ